MNAERLTEIRKLLAIAEGAKASVSPTDWMYIYFSDVGDLLAALVAANRKPTLVGENMRLQVENADLRAKLAAATQFAACAATIADPLDEDEEEEDTDIYAPDTGNPVATAECTCPSLLNGHLPECQMGKP